MTTAVAAPFRFFSLQVARTRRLGPSLVRVAFGGEDLRHFLSDGRDQSLSLFLPHPGQSEPRVPVELGDSWWQGWRELPDDVRAVMRSYTLRSVRRDTDGNTAEIDVDFTLHGLEPGAAVPAGPASTWASRAAAGDKVLLLGPAIADNRAIRFRPPRDTDLVVIWGDETAAPAACSVVESLPAGTRAQVWLEVPHAGDIQDVTTEADAEITWLVREENGAAASPAALRALRDTRLAPAQHPYVWIAGETGCVREVRRHFVHEREFDRRAITFVGYWRRGLTEEQLRERE